MDSRGTEKLVVDTNVLLALIINPNDKLAAFLADKILYAPAFIQLELINVFRKYHFLEGISKDILLKYFDVSVELIDFLYPDEILLEGATKLSFELNHPIYDCLFLQLAIECQIPFVSLDLRLLEKAKYLGIDTMQWQ